jgi:hypothetical protein
MSLDVVFDRARRVAQTCAAPAAERASIVSALSDVAKIESWAAARRAELVRRLGEHPGSFPEADIATTTGCTLHAATKETDRARTLAAAESFAEALDAGTIRPGHVDALTDVTKQLTDDQTATLLDRHAQLATVAASQSIRDFQQHLARAARSLRDDADAEARFQRQQRATRLRTWVDQSDGMWCMSGRFDPKSGREIARALDDAVATLFAEKSPATAPTDRLERQQHLSALALVRLIDGDTTAGSKRSTPGDPIVVVDATTAHPRQLAGPGDPTLDWVLDWGLGIELPSSVLRDVFDTAEPDVVIVANGVVLYAPGRLDLGRTRRLANRAQRRALRGLYATCAVPGCAVHYDRCTLHHIIWWRNGGRTDLDNLLPICTHHHTRLHDDGWQVRLGPHRELTITLADGTVLASPPPKRSAA